MHRLIFARRTRLQKLVTGFCLVSGLLVASAIAGAEGGAADPDAINQRLYQQLKPPMGSGRIETVSGQMYLSKENIDAGTISEALAAMLDLQQTAGQAVAVQRAPRLNFEIHFPKNSADLTPESRKSLDELASALDAEDYTDMRFLLGGHTAQDGYERVHLPLSHARSDTALAYFVSAHSLP